MFEIRDGNQKTNNNCFTIECFMTICVYVFDGIKIIIDDVYLSQEDEEDSELDAEEQKENYLS